MSEYFQLFDRNGDGTVDIDEVREALPKIGLSIANSQLMDLMESMVEKNGKLDVLSFLESLQPAYKGGGLASLPWHIGVGGVHPAQSRP